MKNAFNADTRRVATSCFMQKRMCSDAGKTEGIGKNAKTKSAKDQIEASLVYNSAKQNFEENILAAKIKSIWDTGTMYKCNKRDLNVIYTHIYIYIYARC